MVPYHSRWQLGLCFFFDGFKICGTLLLYVSKSLTLIALRSRKDIVALTSILEFSLTFVLGLELRECRLFMTLIACFDIRIFYEFLEFSGDI